jgi:hypothetical protein
MTALVPGDVDGSGATGLHDAVLALQAAAGIIPATAVDVGADVNGDGAIGVAEAMHALQKEAGRR